MRQYITGNLATPRTQVIDLWAYDWEREITQPDRLLGNFTRSEYLRFSLGPDPRHGMVVLTHSFFYEHMKTWPGFSFSTLLRDPVQRIVSQYHFEKREFAHFDNRALTDWLATLSDFEFNMQTAALCGAPSMAITDISLDRAKANLHCFDHIGFVEDFAASISLFNRIYGIDPSCDCTIPKSNAAPAPHEIDAELRAYLMERCRYDIQLVEYAQRLFRAKLAAFELIDAGDPAHRPASIT